MLKEIDLWGIFLPPFAAYVLAALLLFLPLRRVFDHYAIERWVWHRPLFDISIFVILLSCIGLIFGP